MRLIILRSPGPTETPQTGLIVQDEARIGRHKYHGADGGVDINLESDPAVSRDHARLYREGERWLIEDLGSRSGTFIQGRSIGGLGAQEVEPGALLETGNTVWTILPDDWLVLRDGDLMISGRCASAANYPLHHCGSPVIGELTASNFGQDRTGSRELKLQLVGYSTPCFVHIPPLEPAGKALLGVPGIEFDVDALKRRVEPKSATIWAEIDGRRIQHGERTTSILGFWDWSHDEHARKTIAAFVSPRNQVVERIVIEAQQFLRDAFGIDSFGALLSSRLDDPERPAMEAMYECLAQRYDVRYVLPEVKPCPGGQGTYQPVRPPQQIFLPGTPSVYGEATCLDLAILMAACLESIRLHPLIIFTARERGKPDHALVGCWAGSTPGGRPVIEDEQFLRRQVASGSLSVAECTGCAVGVPGRTEKLTFEQASESALQGLGSSPWLCAVDIGAVRPPYGSVTPMDCPFDPVVERACHEAKQFAESKGSDRIESSHLLSGLLAVNGPIIRHVLRTLGHTPEALRKRIEALMPSRDSLGEARPTRTFIECLWRAERIAWQCGGTSVQEQDLLWSVLDATASSSVLPRVFELLEVDVRGLQRVLARDYPRPDFSFSFSSLDSWEAESRSRGLPKLDGPGDPP